MIKRFSLLTILLSVYVTISMAQSTSRFPINPLARWSISNITNDPADTNGKIITKYEYSIDADTIINSKSYYKLYKSGVAYYDVPFYYEHVYYGAIRDDSNKVYYVYKEADNEVLLFDYNLELGDTLSTHMGFGSIVYKIDTLPDGRRCIYTLPTMVVGCPVMVDLIEGIGHSGGITEATPCEHMGFAGYFLNCFHIDQELIYSNDRSVINCDDFFTNTSISLNNSNIKIYPVPAHNSFTLEMNIQPNTSQTLCIYNISGNPVIVQNINSNKTMINTHNFVSGMYFIKVFDAISSYSQKIIIN